MTSRKDHAAYTRDHFRGMAGHYDNVEIVLGKTRRRIARMVGRGKKVLDVACGTGSQSVAFEGCDVTGIDLSPDMLEKAREKAVDRNISFLEGDATALPFADGEFDISTITLGLHEMPWGFARKTIREMRRVTKGRVILVDYNAEGGFLVRLFLQVSRMSESRYYWDFIRRGGLRGLGVPVKHLGTAAGGILAIGEVVPDSRRRQPRTITLTAEKFSLKSG